MIGILFVYFQIKVFTKLELLVPLPYYFNHIQQDQHFIMGAGWAPLILYTGFFGIIGGVLPKLVPKNWPYRGVTQVALALIGVCCWLFWLCCYMSQMNPLIGPILSQRSLIAAKVFWGEKNW